MTNEQMKALKGGGFDLEKTIERFSGNVDMYERFLKKFPNDESFAQIAPAFAANNREAALNAAHTLKGVSANLGMVGIFLNLLLFAGKLTAALASGSVSVMADAFNNLSDAGSSVVTLIGFKLSGKKPDPQHPFGHGRLEYVAGFVISVFIIVVGSELARDSFAGIRSPKTVEYSTMIVWILAASICVKLYMALYNTLLSRLFESPTMKATARDSLSDVCATGAVLIALLVSHRTGVNLDSWMGLIVSIFILYSGISSAKDTLTPLLGTPPSKELVSEIEQIVMNLLVSRKHIDICQCCADWRPLWHTDISAGVGHKIRFVSVKLARRQCPAFLIERFPTSGRIFKII